MLQRISVSFLTKFVNSFRCINLLDTDEISNSKLVLDLNAINDTFHCDENIHSYWINLVLIYVLYRLYCFL